MTDPMMIKADGNLVLVDCSDKAERAYAMFRVHMPSSGEMLFLVRLYSSKTSGGVVLPGGSKDQRAGVASVKSEIFEKLAPAMKRCEEWLEPLVEVPDVVAVVS